MLTALPHTHHSPPRSSQTREVIERAESVMRDVRELQATPVFCPFDNGTLSPYGRVYSFHAKQLAQTAAAEISGISRVENQLEVVPRPAQ